MTALLLVGQGMQAARRRAPAAASLDWLSGFCAIGSAYREQVSSKTHPNPSQSFYRMN